MSFFLLCYEPIHTHSFNASINSSAHNSLWLQTDSCSSSTAFGGTKLTPDLAATWHLEKTNLELPFLPHFLNLLIQRGSRFLGRKTKARCCERRPEERGRALKGPTVARRCPAWGDSEMGSAALGASCAPGLESAARLGGQRG